MVQPISEEAEHLILLRVIRIDFAGPADHGRTDHMEGIVLLEQLIMEQLIEAGCRIDLARTVC
jgi:hypothetical protein